MFIPSYVMHMTVSYLNYLGVYITVIQTQDTNSFCKLHNLLKINRKLSILITVRQGHVKPMVHYRLQPTKPATTTLQVTERDVGIS